MFDLEFVEVLEGHQGTPALLGSSTRIAIDTLPRDAQLLSDRHEACRKR